MKRLIAEAPQEDALAWSAFLLQSDGEPDLTDLDVLRATYPAAPAKMKLAEAGGSR